jgi:hypothetical protein
LGSLHLQKENNGEWLYIHNKIPVVPHFTAQAILKSIMKDNGDNDGDNENKCKPPDKISYE